MEDVGHFLIGCEFGKGRKSLLEEVELRRLENGWKSLRVWAQRGRWHCCWGRDNEVMVDVGRCSMFVLTEEEGSDAWLPHPHRHNRL